MNRTKSGFSCSIICSAILLFSFFSGSYNSPLSSSSLWGETNKKIKLVPSELDYFRTSHHAEDSIHYMAVLNKVKKGGKSKKSKQRERKTRIPAVLFSDVESYKVEGRVERIMSFRARFAFRGNIQSGFEIFNRAETFNFLNRKTRFVKTENFVFRGERSVFVFTIEFTSRVKVLSTVHAEDDDYQFFFENTGLEIHPSLLIVQKLSDYNSFMVETRFDFGIYHLDNNYNVIEGIGWVAFKSSTPDFLQEKVRDEFPEKILHFKQALEQLLKID